MTSQRIILGDCLDVFANERSAPAFVSDPPANIGFMGRSWDKAHPADDYVPILPPRDKVHLRELQREHAFIKYWAQRYAMAYDIADRHAVNIVWTLPRTSHQTATALRAAGWDIKDNLVHLFGSGWAKTGNALAPGQEGWILATKGKPDLDIDACRVPRHAGGNAAQSPLSRLARGAKPHVATESFIFGTHNAGKVWTPKEGQGSIPKNALLSHCEGCVRVGSKRVSVRRSGNGGNGPLGVTFKLDHHGEPCTNHSELRNGTKYMGKESVPAFHCLAGCVCGASAPWPDDRPLPRCPCGETWRWLCPVAEINGQSGNRPGMSGGGKHRADYAGGLFGGIDCDATTYADQGGAARFFNTFRYLSKCSPSERHAGCEKLFWRADKKDPFGFVQVTREEWTALASTPARKQPNLPKESVTARGNVHPTVKSYRLMHWLHGLTGASRILDMTAGSGTGMYTAFLDGIDWLGAEICPQAIVIAEARLAFWRGLSFDARRAFTEDDAVPERVERSASQATLF